MNDEYNHPAIEKYQEDFVVWAPDMKNRLSIQMASVCFPSGWDPNSKVNKSFAEIHEPVADNKLIMTAADSIATMITQRARLFGRYGQLQTHLN